MRPLSGALGERVDPVGGNGPPGEGIPDSGDHAHAAGQDDTRARGRRLGILKALPRNRWRWEKR